MFNNENNLILHLAIYYFCSISLIYNVIILLSNKYCKPNKRIASTIYKIPMCNFKNYEKVC